MTTVSQNTPSLVIRGIKKKTGDTNKKAKYLEKLFVFLSCSLLLRKLPHKPGARCLPLCSAGERRHCPFPTVSLSAPPGAGGASPLVPAVWTSSWESAQLLPSCPYTGGSKQPGMCWAMQQAGEGERAGTMKCTPDLTEQHLSFPAAKRGGH